MKKILVIAEDAMVRSTVERCFATADCDVITTHDGMRGIGLVRSKRPDLVVTDAMVPKPEGTLIVTQISRANPNAKIIAICSRGVVGNSDLLAMAQAKGALRVIPEPLDPGKLVTAIEECLDERHCPVDAAAHGS